MMSFWDRDEPKPFPGYSTDVWFDQSMQFIDRALADEVPFFLYLPTNCPPQPVVRFRDHYRDPLSSISGTASQASSA